jgi:polyferredoxin
MKDMKRIYRELNREERYPSYFRSHDFKMFMLIFLLVLVLILGILLVLAFKELIDTKGQFVAAGFIVLALFSFAMWALFFRR